MEAIWTDCCINLLLKVKIYVHKYSMDHTRNQNIAKQVDRWDVYARLTPTAFLLVSLILILFDVISFDQAFYVGIVGFAITAVVWWWWAIFTIKYLVTTLNRASANLQEVNNEILLVTKEIQALKNEQ